MISIRFLKATSFLFATCFIIGVILCVLSVIRLNHTYANTSQSNESFAITMIPFYWLIMLIGGLILITLSYVSWRKYKGMKARQKDRGSNN